MMEPVPEIYAKLQTELQPYLPLLGQVADTVLDADVSAYPIFAVHQLELDLGILVLARQPEQLRWSVQISTLEEMAAKKLIAMEKVDGFRKVYKNPHEFLCLLVLSDQGAQFVFLPRQDG